MPWLAKTFWQLLLSLDLFCCRHCWTALSLPSNCRQKRDASRLQACCSCGVPMWLWASEDEIPNSSVRTATTYRMTISRNAAIICWSRLQRSSSATVPKLVFENRTPDHGARSELRYHCKRDLSQAMSKPAMLALVLVRARASSTLGRCSSSSCRGSRLPWRSDRSTGYFRYSARRVFFMSHRGDDVPRRIRPIKPVYRRQQC